MKKPNTPSKWNSSDKSRTVLASVPAPGADKADINVTRLPAKSAETSPPKLAPADDKRDGKR